MYQTKGLVLAVLLGLFSQTSQAATVQFSEEVYPLKVNAKVVEHSLFGKTLELELPVGQHRVQLKYNDIYELDYDEHQVVESEPFWVLIDIQQDGLHKIAFERPESVQAAEVFAQNPRVSFIAPNNQTAEVAVVTEVEKAKPIVKAKAQSNTKNTFKKQDNGPNAEDMLQYWWQQATDTQRDTFLRSIKKGQ